MTFENFLADMGERPGGMSIDRFPDRSGNYEPGNVRWATAEEQARNRSSTVLWESRVSEIRGRSEHGEANRSIASRMGINGSLVWAVLNNKIWRES